MADAIVFAVLIIVLLCETYRFVRVRKSKRKCSDQSDG